MSEKVFSEEEAESGARNSLRLISRLITDAAFAGADPVMTLAEVERMARVNRELYGE